MATKEQYEKVVKRLKEISAEGIMTREGKKEFLFGFDVEDESRLSVHGLQFSHSHINKFTSLLNRIDCEYWIYPSNAIDGWVMLVVNVFVQL